MPSQVLMTTETAIHSFLKAATLKLEVAQWGKCLTLKLGNIDYLTNLLQFPSFQPNPNPKSKHKCLQVDF